MRMRWPGFRKVRNQVNKRLSRRFRELGLAGVEEYRAYLEAHLDEWVVLDGLCRITISRFLRDRGVWEIVRRTVLPELATAAQEEGREKLKIWSAGCGSGEEPYTFSLVWRLPSATAERARHSHDQTPSATVEAAPALRLRILATDADPRLLDRAGAAVYPRGTLKELPEEWVASAFVESGGQFELRDGYKEDVRFLQHDVRDPSPDEAFDLIACRNLAFTYFDEELQGEVLSGFLGRLNPGGILFLGGHENLPPGTWPLTRIHSGQPLFRNEDSNQ
jgi:chemotaxis protein methyltransferase CheR